MSIEEKRLDVWIVQFSKNHIDDIADSSISGVYETEEQAKMACQYENSLLTGWHYYYEQYPVIPKEKIKA